MASIDPINDNNTDRVSNTQVIKQKTQSKAQAVQQPAKTDSTNIEQTRNHMHRWFAQAGVAPSTTPNLKQDTGKRLSRRQNTMNYRKLENLENILALALDFCSSHSSEENLDPDWFFSFVALAEEIYSPPMQELWGKIFAVEVGKPGTFSLRTLQTLKTLTQKDALLFKNAVNIACRKKGEHGAKLLFGYYEKPSFLSLLKLPRNHQINLGQFGLSYPNLLSLMDMGLIYNSEIESGELPLNQNEEWRCGNQSFHLAAKQKGLTLNYYKFTSTGSELLRLVAPATQDAYIQAIKETLKPGFKIS